jgi:hypothetical protein
MIQEELELRQAKKLGLLAVALLALFVGYGVLSSTQPADAQATKVCTGVPGGTVAPGGVDQCVVTVATIPLAPSSSLSVLGASTFAVSNFACVSNVAGVTATVSVAGGCIYTTNATTTVPVGSAIGTETFTIAATALSGACLSQSVTNTTGTGTAAVINLTGFIQPTGPGACVAGGDPPTDEFKTCTNTATNALLNQTLGGSSQTLAVSGPSKTFTLPLFAGASTCAIQLYRNGIPCNLTTNVCADGNVQVTLSTGAGAAIDKATAPLAARYARPVVPATPMSEECELE